MKVICEGCGQPVEVADPSQEILNSPNLSVVALSHPKEGYCFNCKSKVALFLQGAQCMVVAKPLRSTKSPIVVASASALPRAK